MSDNNCINDAFLFGYICAFSVILIVVFTMFSMLMCSSIATYTNELTPYTDVITVNDKIDSINSGRCVYCNDEVVRYVDNTLVYFQLNPGKTYIVKCYNSVTPLFKENIVISEVIREVAPGEDVSFF